MNTTPEQIGDSKPAIFKIHSSSLKELNEAIASGFLSHYEDSDVKRTHLFNGRYENIYLDETHIPELKNLLDEACQHANHILNQENTQAGCWFNHMPPGSITLPHRHDDDDELLSAVYYVEVPENSGNLIIHTGDGDTLIKPQAGMFVFFNPDVSHEVTENKSRQNRLSIGINFGLKRKEVDL